MAHYAELDANSVVLRVIVGVDEMLMDGEKIYAQTTNTIWKRTSYHTRGGVHVLGGVPFRLNYAGIGHSYNIALDGFIPARPFPSWALVQTSGLWQSPVPYPQDSNRYYWNEESQTWTPVLETVTAQLS